MAEDAIDKALASGRLHAAGPCRTRELPLAGARGYTPDLFADVAQHYRVPHRPGAIDTAVARYLAGGALSLSCLGCLGGCPFLPVAGASAVGLVGMCEVEERATQRVAGGEAVLVFRT